MTDNLNDLLYSPKIASAIRKIRLQQKISRISIVIGFVVIFISINILLNQGLFNENNEITVINKYNQQIQKFDSEKVMINPNILISDENGDYYKISAKQAASSNLEDFYLENVELTGKIGKISAGSLNISDNGNLLIFSKNPVIIIDGDIQDQSKK